MFAVLGEAIVLDFHSAVPPTTSTTTSPWDRRVVFFC